MTIVTIGGLYDTYDAAAQTVRELEALPVPSGDISLVAHRNGHDGVANETWNEAEAGAEIGASAGGLLGGGAGLLAGLGIMAIPGVGPVVAAGWLVATAAGAVVGIVAGGAAGGLIGSLTSAGVGTDQAHFYAEGIRRGGALVTARVDESSTQAVEAIMRRHGRIHATARGKIYRDGGWREFDETSPPLNQAALEKERTLYQSGPLV